MDGWIHRTQMRLVERIDADLFGFYPLAGSALAYGVRRGMIPLTNWYGTGSGSDLAPCRQQLPSLPGRYRSLYRTVLRIRQRYHKAPRSGAFSERFTHMIILQLIALFVVSWFAASVSDDGRWPQFRGPQSVGVVEDPQLPDKWGATENVAWKSDIPGLGWSSPIVWGDRIFVTSVISSAEI